MRQRLGLAAALMRRPRVLLLDEPANGLDPTGADELWQMVRALAGEGTAVLLSSHDLMAIDDVCDEITVLRAGEVAWSGPIADLRAQAPAPEHVLRTADDTAAAERVRVLGIPVGGRRRRPARDRRRDGHASSGSPSRSAGPASASARSTPGRLAAADALRPPHRGPGRGRAASSPSARRRRSTPRPVGPERRDRGRRPTLADVLAVCAVESRKLRARR